MKKLLVAFLILAFNLSYAEETLNSVLKDLDEHIQNKEKYQNIKEEKIKFLKKFLAESSNNANHLFTYDINKKLFEEYKSYTSTAAFDYAYKMIQIAHLLKNDSLLNYAKIDLSFAMLSAGLFKETLDTLHSIDIKTLPIKVKIKYYKVLMRAQFDMSDYSNNEVFGYYYNNEATKCLNELRKLTPKGTADYLSLEGLNLLRLREFKDARAIYEKLLSNYNLSPQQYAVEASSLGHIYQCENMPEKAAILMAKAAMCDLETSTKETLALLNLADYLYKKGHTDQPYLYIKNALDDANFYGAKHRKIKISDILPIIEKKQLTIIKSQNSFFVMYSVIVTVLIIILILFSIIIFFQFKKQRQSKALLDSLNKTLIGENNKLSESNKINEELIGLFFFTIVNYIKKIETFTVTVDRRLNAKKYDEIKEIINNINISNERIELQKNFDEVFFKIFPNFVCKFNDLFNEEDRITLDPNEPMSVELRIFALVRLGISDNEKIAKILNYSVNTIYSYKTKIRNKSIVSNDLFESKLMEIRE